MLNQAIVIVAGGPGKASNTAAIGRGGGWYAREGKSEI